MYLESGQNEPIFIRPMIHYEWDKMKISIKKTPAKLNLKGIGYQACSILFKFIDKIHL